MRRDELRETAFTVVGLLVVLLGLLSATGEMAARGPTWLHLVAVAWGIGMVFLELLSAQMRARLGSDRSTRVEP